MNNIHVSRLKELLHTNWNQIPQNDIDHIVLFMPNRCKAIMNIGRHTLLKLYCSKDLTQLQ